MKDMHVLSARRCAVGEVEPFGVSHYGGGPDTSGQAMDTVTTAEPRKESARLIA